VGRRVGVLLGLRVGLIEGTLLGLYVGGRVGIAEGLNVGMQVGVVGLNVGGTDGFALVGLTEGLDVEGLLVVGE